MKFSSKFFTSLKRSVGVSDLLKICFAASVITGLLAAFFSDSQMPGLPQIMLGLLPYFFFSAIVAIAFRLLAQGEKNGEAVTGAFFIVALGALVGILAACCKIWNNGSSYTVLPPSHAWLNILTFGIYPAHFGPLVQIRFLPAVIFLSLGIMLSRRGLPKSKSWGLAAGAYLTTAFSFHGLSWIAWLGLQGGTVSIKIAADTFRFLVRMHTTSFWSLAQLDRFLLPLGRQAESTLLMVQVAVMFLLAAGLLALIFIKSIRAWCKLAKRVLVQNSVPWVLAALIGVVLARTSQVTKASYTHILALIIFALVIVLWIAWWQYGRDLENLAQDELRQADLPLPRGEVSLQEVEGVRQVLLIASLFGAWCLGWPVFIGILSAVFCTWLISRYGAGFGASSVAEALGAGVIGLSLAWAGAAFSLRDASSPAWIVAMALAVGILVGLSQFIKNTGDSILTSRYALWLILICLVVVPLASRQKFMWVICLAAGVLTFVLSRNAEKWRRYGIFVMDAALAVMALIALFVPKLIRHL